MNLSQILIEYGVTPDDLHPDCKFIAQDGDDCLLVEYVKKPELMINCLVYSWVGMAPRMMMPCVVNLADDWKTPLSREQFIADYEAHCAKRP